MIARPKSSEIAVLVIVSLMSFMANLPNSLIGSWLDKRLLLAALTLSVLIAMLRHLRALLSLSIAILAIGANLPESLAASLGVSPVVMMIALATVVIVTLLNHAFNMLPSGISADNPEDSKTEPALALRIVQPLLTRIDTPESRLAVLLAASKGDSFALERMMNMNVEINFSLDGQVPILIVAEKGYSDIMRTMIQHKVDLQVRNKDGKTPFEIALAKKDFTTAEILYSAVKNDLPKEERTAFVDLFFAHRRNLSAN